MTFQEYQQAALHTARPPEAKDELFHLVLGLVGESGEIAEKMKKWVRDDTSDPARLNHADMQKELGDVLWYVAVLSSHLKLDLEEVAAQNISKLASRQVRGVLHGKGDNR